MAEKKTSTSVTPKFNKRYNVTIVSAGERVTLPVEFEMSEAGMIEFRMKSERKHDIKTKFCVKNNKKSNIYRKLNLLYGVK